jgi:hypothetical protein
MKSGKYSQQTTVLVLLFAATVTALLFSASAGFAQTKPDQQLSAEQLQQLNKYPLKDFGELFSTLQKEVTLPAPRNQSQLLSLLPQSSVFYAAFPNYGPAAQQALQIFQRELQTRPALRKWWQRGDMAKIAPQIEMAVAGLGVLSQYVGDEVVISGAMNEKGGPSIVVLAQIKKPGFKQALELALLQMSASKKPNLRVFDVPGLAAATDSMPRNPVVLVRQDYVIAASDLATLRKFNSQIDAGTHAFASTSFGRRLQQSYSDGISILGGVDLQTILRQAPIPPAQSRTLADTGFSDVKYLIWEHKDLAGTGITQGELSFTGPRHGIAAWLAAPRDLNSLDFASPNAILVASIALKNLGDAFDDIRTLASASNPNAFAQFDAMQQGMGFNLKDDLLSQLGGEITLEVDDVTDGQPTWKAILQVNDAARLQQTLNKLLAMSPVPEKQSREGGIVYHSMTIPTPQRTTEIGYAFVDGYLVIASGSDKLREAVRLHREGGSLAKAPNFLAALPPGQSTKASVLYYSDPIKTLGLQLAKLSPELAQSISHDGQTSPVVTCAYAEESTIRGTSMSRGFDVGTMMVLAAVAIPNAMRAKSTADESSAVAELRTMVTAQTTYANAYPARGFARNLATLGPDPLHPDSSTPQHAAFIDATLGKSTCTTGAWCEKSGYKFTLSPVCPKLLCQEFVAIATPVAASGTKNFCVTSDGVVRFRVEAPLIAPILASQCRTWQPLE